MIFHKTFFAVGTALSFNTENNTEFHKVNVYSLVGLLEYSVKHRATDRTG